MRQLLLRQPILEPAARRLLPNDICSEAFDFGLPVLGVGFQGLQARVALGDAELLSSKCIDHTYLFGGLQIARSSSNYIL